MFYMLKNDEDYFEKLPNIFKNIDENQMYECQISKNIKIYFKKHL